MFSHYSKSLVPSSHKEAVVLPRGITRLCQEAWDQEILGKAMADHAARERVVSDPYWAALDLLQSFPWPHLRVQADKAWAKYEAWRKENPHPEGDVWTKEAQDKRRQAQELAEVLLEKEPYIRFLL